MKKRFSVCMLVAAVCVMLFSVTAFAQEITDPTTVIKEEAVVQRLAIHQAEVAKQLQAYAATQINYNVAYAHGTVVVNQLKAYNRAEADNYILYLKRVVINLKETERIKKEVVDNYLYLSQFNPFFNTLVPKAVEDYNTAVAWRQYYEQYVVKVTKDFEVLYPR